MAEQIPVSIPQKLYQRILELAQVRRQPVNDVLVEVLERALPLSGDQNGEDEDAIVEREMQAYIALHPMLKEKFLGQHVAIYRGELIDRDDDFAALYERIDAQYTDEFVWLATVEEEAMPTLMMA